MMFGAVNWIVLFSSVLIIGTAKLESMGWGIVFIYILAGSGRAVFEGTNKATFADFFPRDKEAAFANSVVFSGGSAAIGFLILPHISYVAMGVAGCIVSALAIPALYRSFALYGRERQRLIAASPDRY